MVNESVPSSKADLLSLSICGVEVMSSASILEVHVGATVSTLLSNKTRIWELESQLACKNSKFDAGTM